MKERVPDFSFDRPREECGICGIHGNPEAANLSYLALYALQHRGQEAAGIVASTGREVKLHKAQGQVADIFTRDVLEGLPGTLAVGHVRYSTTGGSHIRNAAPFLGKCADGMSVAVAHNGNLVNTPEVRAALDRRGVEFTGTTDSECMMHAIRLADGVTFEERVINGLTPMKGAFSLAIMSEDTLIAVRDPSGFRPLALGKLREGGWAVASETCAFDLIEAKYEREIEPGEVLVIGPKGHVSHHPFEKAKSAMCIFEFIYFSRPDSLIFGHSVQAIRKELGRQLAWEAPARADVVVPVPDSALVAALGYAECAKIPYESGLIRNHYVGRTFIEPSQHIRDFGTKIKLNPVRAAIEGKRVVLVDDSIVRGTTLKKITKMIREAGAKEIHLRISSPPHKWPCYYGIDFPTRHELIAATHSKEEIRKFLNVESLEYVSVEGLLKAVRNVKAGFCLACFDGRYPVEFEQAPAKDALEAAAVARAAGRKG